MKKLSLVEFSNEMRNAVGAKKTLDGAVYVLLDYGGICLELPYMHNSHGMLEFILYDEGEMLSILAEDSGTPNVQIEGLAATRHDKGEKA